MLDCIFSIGVGSDARSSFATRSRVPHVAFVSKLVFPHVSAMASMSAVAPVCLRASAPSARKSRAGNMSSRVVAPAVLRTSAVTGRRANGMSVSLHTRIICFVIVHYAKPRVERPSSRTPRAGDRTSTSALLSSKAAIRRISSFFGRCRFSFFRNPDASQQHLNATC